MNTDTLFKQAGKIYRAINHPLRKQILELLTDKEVFVTTLYVKLRLEQSVCSQHLAILRNAGLVKTRRDGKFLYYTKNDEKYNELVEVSRKLVGAKETESETINQ